MTTVSVFSVKYEKVFRVYETNSFVAVLKKIGKSFANQEECKKIIIMIMIIMSIINHMYMYICMSMAMGARENGIVN